MPHGGDLDAEAVVHGVAGALGGVLAIGLFFPLEVLRTRLQVGDPSVVTSSFGAKSRSGGPWGALLRIARREGVGALYQGFHAVLVTVGASQFVYFCMYRALKQIFGMVTTPVANLAIAAIAGSVTVLLTTPLWLVNTRMKVQQQRVAALRTQWPSVVGARPGISDFEAQPVQPPGGGKPYDGLVDGLVRICREEGLATLWGGMVPSLILVSSPAIQWAVYEFEKDRLADLHGGAPPSQLETFASAAMAKAIATVATYPLQVAQAALQCNRNSVRRDAGEDKASQRRYRGTLDCLAKLYHSGGFHRLFRGFQAKMLQTVLTAALHIVCYEKIVRILFALLSPWQMSGMG